MNPNTATTTAWSAKPAAEREIAPLVTDFAFEVEEPAEDEDTSHTEGDPETDVSPSTGCPASLHASTYSKKERVSERYERLDDPKN
ncbi:hypothetical protein FRC00_013520, partial [Tulasnella sp. 408]